MATSNYRRTGKGKVGAGRGQSRSQSNESTLPTHYAVQLVRDAEGNVIENDEGQLERTFLDGLLIYEGKNGSLKVKVGDGHMPTETFYIFKKKSDA